jgi:hypothetical protein
MVSTPTKPVTDDSGSSAWLFYGGIKLEFAGFSQQFEFPISLSNSRVIRGQIEAGSDWFKFETLDNWIVVVRREEAFVELYDDADEAAPSFMLPEVYMALASDLQLEEQNLSDELRTYCQQKAEEYQQQNDDTIWDLLNTARFITRSGQEYAVSLRHNIDCAWDLIEIPDDMPKTICLGDDRHYYFDSSHLVMLLVPLEAYRRLKQEIDPDEEIDSDD